MTASITPSPEMVERAMKPISMGDVRLAAGEGQLSAHDVLAAVNGILASRRRSLTAALSCPDGFRLGWRPIESAPKDGRLLLLYCPAGIDRQGFGDNDPPETIGSFDDGQWKSVETIMEYHDYGGMTGVSTWTEQIVVSPTYWQPLPSAPSQDAPQPISQDQDRG